jgi:uncharacterized DUF497 family protein
MPVDLLTPTLAVEALRECLKNSGKVKPTRHFLEKLEKEGLSIPDVWQVLRSGCIFDPAEQEIKNGEWKYKIEGKTPDGRWIAIIYCIKAADRTNLVTVFSVEGGDRK